MINSILFSLLIPPEISFIKSRFVRIIVDADKAWISKPEMLYDSFSADNIKHFILELKLGKNEFILYYDKNKKTESKIITVYFFPSFNFKTPLQPYKFHRSENEKICRACHDIEFKRVSKKEDLSCFICHKEKFEKGLKFHPPFDDPNCSECHKRIFEEPEEEKLCVNCHELKDDFYLHSPYAMFECGICHDPHSSMENKLLKDRIQILCTLCHEKELYSYHHPVANHPAEKSNLFCNSCHDPHGTRFGYHLKWPNKPVCTVCHKK
ncbi:MAG: cytochrome c3 family protein [Candidatus Hydrothermales bacterium]